MSTKDNRTSLAFGIPGLLMQVVGYFLMHEDQFIFPALFFLLMGVIFLCVGFGFYAKAKGQNPAWGLLGLCGIIGLIILALIPDNHPERQRQMQNRRRRSRTKSNQNDHALAELERE